MIIEVSEFNTDQELADLFVGLVGRQVIIDNPDGPMIPISGTVKATDPKGIVFDDGGSFDHDNRTAAWPGIGRIRVR